MKNIIISVVVSLLLAPNIVSAASPFNYIYDQLDQLNSEVTANTAAINNLRSVNIYVDGVRRGTLLDANRNSAQFSVFNSLIYRALLDSGYFAVISVTGDGLKQVNLGYESTDCNGQAYIARGSWTDIVARQGIVLSNASPAPGSIYMIQSGTASEIIQVESWTFDGTCVTESFPDMEVYKAFANVPEITGVAQGDFVGEVTLGF